MGPDDGALAQALYSFYFLSLFSLSNSFGFSDERYSYQLDTVRKLEKHGITSTVTQNSRHAKVLLTSKIAADDVLEAYKSQDGTKVFLYERKPLASAIKPSRLEQAAQDCR